MKQTRTILPKVTMLRTMRQDIGLKTGQYFCKTPKAYEIWQENPLFRLKRIPSRKIFWVIEK